MAALAKAAGRALRLNGPLCLATGVALVLACEAPPGAGVVGESPGSRGLAGAPERTESELVRSLVELGYAALDLDQPETAEDRFERALAVEPGSSRARTGLARVALARGDRPSARDHLERAVARDPAAVGARVVLADLERGRGKPARARSLLAEAVAVSPLDPVANAAWSEATGLAPPVSLQAGAVRPEDAATVREVALAHPYDLAAAVRWARLARLANVGQGEAEASLDTVSARLWLSDTDMAAAAEGLALLRAHHSAWADRRVVWVHSFADETIRRHPGWQMRMRGLWRGQNEALEPLLRTVYLPASIGAFSARDAGWHLGTVHDAWVREVDSFPADGILAAFTERAGPRREGYQLGVAELSGRRLIVRLAPGEVDSRTLAHEVLHLYGAVHIRKEVDSLMNPSGDSVTIDRANHRIVALARDRQFGEGGFFENTFPFVDATALTAAYAALLRVNLEFRAVGLDRALEAVESSRYYAADLAREEVVLDGHFGDVASFVADLLVYQDRLVEAALFLDGASRLYGADTLRGVATRQRFDALYALLKARGDVR